MRRLAAIATGLLLLLAACRKQGHEEPAAPPPAVSLSALSYRDAESNLLGLMHGAAVVDRSGEWTLTSAAQSAFDGDLTSSWTTTPGEHPREQATIALRVPARIERVALWKAPGAEPGRVLKRVRFEISSDGKTFAPLAEVELPNGIEQKSFAVTPAVASFVRVTLLSNQNRGWVINAGEIAAFGSELAAPQPPHLSGVWSVNGDRCLLQSDRSMLEGYLERKRSFFLDGGWDGSVFRVLWTGPKEYGTGVLAFDPAGQRMSGAEWHLHAVEDRVQMPTWYGSRQGDGEFAGKRPDSVAGHVLASGSYPLFGLVFDRKGTLDRAASLPQLQRLLTLLQRGGEVRFVARELREDTEAANHARAERELASLRAALQALGSPAASAPMVVLGANEGLPRPAREPLQRYMLSRVELQLLGH